MHVSKGRGLLGLVICWAVLLHYHVETKHYGEHGCHSTNILNFDMFPEKIIWYQAVLSPQHQKQSPRHPIFSNFLFKITTNDTESSLNSLDYTKQEHFKVKPLPCICAIWAMSVMSACSFWWIYSSSSQLCYETAVVFKSFGTLILWIKGWAKSHKYPGLSSVYEGKDTHSPPIFCGLSGIYTHYFQPSLIHMCILNAETSSTHHLGKNVSSLAHREPLEQTSLFKNVCQHRYHIPLIKRRNCLMIAEISWWPVDPYYRLSWYFVHDYQIDFTKSGLHAFIILKLS